MPKRRVSYRQEWVRCGKARCRCARAGEKHGPYWYASWTDEQGRRRKRYIGKVLRKITPEELSAPPRPVRLPRAGRAPKPLAESPAKIRRAKPSPSKGIAPKTGPHRVRAAAPTRATENPARTGRAARKASPRTASKPANMPSPIPAATLHHSPIPREAVLEAIRNNGDPRMGLAFVPTVVRALGRPIPEVHRALLDAARQGAIELRPESGLSRLSAEELAACVPGPWDTRLSWVRVL